jgi:hypothetical protein
MGRVIVVSISRTHARLFDVTAGGVAELACLTALATRGGRFHSDRHGSPGGGEKEYHHRIEHEREAHYEAIRERLEQLGKGSPVQGLLVTGPVREVSAFTGFLDGHLADILLGTERTNPRAITPATARRLALTHWERKIREGERRDMIRLLESAGEGWAVTGVQPTMRALAAGQVRKLYARADSPAAEVGEAVAEARAHRIPVVMLHDPEAAGQLTHLGGLLRYRTA